MEKEIKIKVPEGYEIDKKNSTFELIKFKKIGSEFPKSWEELKYVPGCFVNSSSDIVTETHTVENNKNIFATEEQAEAALALAQLSQLKKVYREIEEGEIDWNSNSNKYVISFRNGVIDVDWSVVGPTFLAFTKPETRDLFFENFKDLIEQAKPLIVGE
jgi:hypothetical protein